LLVWKTLSKASPSVLKAQYRPNQQRDLRERPSSIVYQLQSSAWIPDRNRVFHKPEDIYREILHPDFVYDDRNGWLTAIGFGENAKKQGIMYKKKEDMAQHLGIPFALVEIFNSLPEEKKGQLISQAQDLFDKAKSTGYVEPLPTSKTFDITRREEKARELTMTADDKTYEERTRSVRVSSFSNDPHAKEYLRNHNSNENRNVICQLCDNEMPFKLNDGYDYFEAVQFISAVEKEILANHIALCPNCAAEFKHVCNTSEDGKKALLLALDSKIAEGSMIITLDMPFHKQLRFTQNHLIDLQGALQVQSLNNESPQKMLQVIQAVNKQSAINQDIKVKQVYPEAIRSNHAIIEKPPINPAVFSRKEYNECPYCKMQIKAYKYLNHINIVCPQKDLMKSKSGQPIVSLNAQSKKAKKKTCPKCREKIKEGSVQEHLDQRCRTRNITFEPQLLGKCRYCKKKMAASELSTHYSICHILKLKESSQLTKSISERQPPISAKPVALNKSNLVMKKCPYCGRSFEKRIIDKHKDICNIRHGEVKHNNLIAEVTSGHVLNRPKCRFCGRQAMFASDVCYSCSSD